jgi:prepilin-type N-terminal cleavage/methylation domain-containing protein
MKKAFTLVELIIVIVIIGILASIGIPRFTGAIRMAKESEAKAILGAIRSSQLRYELENGSYTTDINNLDIDLPSNPTEYYTYSAIDSSPNIGQAAAVADTGLSNYRIAVDGTISAY